MCGIVGCINLEGKSMASVIRALKSLQNRGYDSVGIATCDNGLLVDKTVSTSTSSAMDVITRSNLVDSNTRISLGHTRWATHGAKTLDNCHPHFDSEKRYALVHNGIVENYLFLKDKLVSQCYGQTDSEIVAKCFAEKGLDAFNDLEGSWAILVLDHHNPDIVHIAKNGSPLLLGTNKTRTKAMLVSEASGFDNDIVSYAVIPDRDIQTLSIVDNKIVLPGYVFKNISLTDDSSLPDSYDHWMMKEIYDQPKAIQDTLNERIIFDTIPDHVIILACGTSYHASQIGVSLMRRMKASFSTSVIDGADFEAHDIIQGRKNLIILVSQSGETRDLYRALQIARQHNVETVGIINVKGSLISREVDRCFYTKAGKEHAVASTKSFVSQIAMLVNIAISLTKDKDPSITKALCDLSNDVDKAITSCQEHSKKLVDFFDGQTSCFILGKHVGEWIAKEGALKIKEVSYVHAEGYGASALKHGPFALITEGVPVIILCKSDEYYPKIINVINEVKSRHATVIVVTNVPIPNGIADYVINLDTDSTLFEISAIVPLQLLSYYLAVNRGYNPDYPRNLAKVVTVE